MREGSVVLVALPQADGQVKPRPALVLRTMPPFQDFLLAGVSSQLRQAVVGFDEVLALAEKNSFQVAYGHFSSTARISYSVAVAPRATTG